MNVLDSNLISILAMASVAAASGLIGAFALMRKMTLAADAMSHVALPGVGVAILLKLNPIIGGAVALAIGAVLVWLLERKTMIATETIIGVLFSASLAVGTLLTPENELIDTLFGDLAKLTFTQAIIGIVAAVVIIGLVLFLKSRLTIALISPDLAKTSGLDYNRLNLWFLLLFVGTVLLGLNFLGILLMGSLIIVPAAASKNFARSFNSDLIIAASVSIFSVLAGLAISERFSIALGPTIISVAAAVFFISILFRRSG